MSKIIATAVMRGTRDLVARTDELLKKTIAAEGKDYAFEFPDTAFYLPMIYAMKAFKVQTLGDMEVALGFAKELLHEDPSEDMWSRISVKPSTAAWLHCSRRRSFWPSGISMVLNQPRIPIRGMCTTGLSAIPSRGTWASSL